MCVWRCWCSPPVGCGLDFCPAPAACAAAVDPDSAGPGPAGRLPSVFQGTAGRPERASVTKHRLGPSQPSAQTLALRVSTPPPDLLVSSAPSALSPAAAATRSSPSSGLRSSPPPGCPGSRCPRPSLLRASSWETSRSAPADSDTNVAISARSGADWFVHGFRVGRRFTCMILFSWLFCCNSRVFSCSKVKMYSAVCCRMAAWRQKRKGHVVRC